MSTNTMVLSPQTAQELADLKGELQNFERKYGMSFEAYRQVWNSEGNEAHFTFEAENDYLMWEGMVTRYKRLNE